MTDFCGSFAIANGLRSECCRPRGHRGSCELVASHSRTPLVSPERATAIKAFRRSLTLLEEAYGVKIAADSDGSKDILILDTTRTLPTGYYYDARIDERGELELAEWILEDESGATNQ